MNYKDKGYNRLLVGDFYYWEIEDLGIHVSQTEA